MRIDRHLTDDDLAKSLRRDAAAGLSAAPKVLPSKWFYDERGSALFEAITRVDDYYLTRTERGILARNAEDIAAVTGADTLVELGSGSGHKTRLLLEALRAAGALRRFVPVDVSGDFLERAAGDIDRDLPGVEVRAVVADFERHLALLPAEGRRLVAMLGSTIGNQAPEQRAAFLADVHGVLEAGDSLLLGADLVKAPWRLLAAYDDPSGVTAEFNRNVLHVLNRELGADFVPAGFAHVAVWDAERERIEMRLRSEAAVRVRLAALDLEVDFAAGEQMRTEISTKFRLDGLTAELRAAGFTPTGRWTDPHGDFALVTAGR